MVNFYVKEWHLNGLYLTSTYKPHRRIDKRMKGTINRKSTIEKEKFLSPGDSMLLRLVEPMFLCGKII